jgi:hypothetical protein
MAEGGSGGEACLARIYLPAIFGGQPAQIECLDGRSRRVCHDLRGQFRQSERFAHLSGTSVLTAARTINVIVKSPAGKLRVGTAAREAAECRL